MGTMELKSDLHKIIDRIQSEQLLRSLHEFLKVREGNHPGKLWNSLTETQKQAVFSSYEESEEEDNLLDRDKVFGKKK